MQIQLHQYVVYLQLKYVLFSQLYMNWLSSHLNIIACEPQASPPKAGQSSGDITHTYLYKKDVFIQYFNTCIFQYYSVGVYKQIIQSHMTLVYIYILYLVIYGYRTSTANIHNQSISKVTFQYTNCCSKCCSFIIR